MLKTSQKSSLLSVLLGLAMVISVFSGLPAAAADPSVTGGDTISSDGTYTVAPDATGTITVNAGLAVTLVGSGINSPANTKLTIDCNTGTELTIQDLYIKNDGGYINGFNFTGAGNKFILKGTNWVDANTNSSGKAVIHVGPGTALTIEGEGTLYLYKNCLASGIGGDGGEASGTITFAGGKLFVKGSKIGAVIGGADPVGDIYITGGVLNIEANARAAAIGGNAGGSNGTPGTVGGTVYMSGGTVSITNDFSGSAIGSGDVIDAVYNGNLFISGGSLKTYITNNAAVYGGWGAEQEGINDAAITASKTDAMGNPVYKLAFNTRRLETAAASFNVKVDGNDYYSGGLHKYDYTGSTTSTVANWSASSDKHLYLYLSGQDHTLTVNGETFQVTWDNTNSTFNVAGGSEGGGEIEYADIYNYYEILGSITITGYKGEGGDVIIPAEIDGIPVTTIAKDAFKEKTSINSIVIPDSVTTIGDNAFRGPGNPSIVTNLTSVTMPKQLTSLGSYAFAYCRSLNTINLPDNLTNIPSRAFMDCKALTNITIPASVKSIDTSAFSNCTALTSVVIPDGVTTIGNSAFSGCTALTKIVIPASVTSFGNSTSVPANATIFCNENSAAQTYAINNNIKYVITWDGSVDVSWYNTTDTEFDISTPAQLAGLAALVNGHVDSSVTADKITGTFTPSADYSTGIDDFDGKTINLTADLDMGGVYNNSTGTWSGPNYTPVGGQWPTDVNDPGTVLSTSFNGTFDGQGHSVKNIYFSRHQSNYRDCQSAGLIGRLGCHDNDDVSLRADNPTVRNVAVTGYIFGNRSIGGIVGKIGKTNKGGIIENCANFATIKATDSKGVGGICGAAWNGGSIRNCYNAGSVSNSGAYITGGIAGGNEIPVINCYNIGTVTAGGTTYALALGNNAGGYFSNCYYLAGSGATAGGVYSPGIKDVVYEKTSNEMKTVVFLAELNGDGRAFVADTENINNGYPILRVQTLDTSTLTNITKASDPTKLTYVAGQSFDDTGLALWANYSDGTREKITTYTISKTDVLATSDTMITISGSYGGLSYSYDFNITVEANALSDPPALSADSTNNNVGQDVCLSFIDNESWRNAISSISVDGTPIDSNKYTPANGTITIDKSMFGTAKDYAIVIKAGGYNDAAVNQTIQAAVSAKPVYTVTPAIDTVYSIGSTTDGIPTMTVNNGNNGLKYFNMGISPVTAHSGDETAVFVHIRDGVQKEINATRADFDQVKNASAGFNVQAGDVVKVYLVDDLSNATDFNPIVLQ